jgi:RNA 3'-phosphate cyclase
MGYDIELEVLSRGFYPEGGGKVRAILSPCPRPAPLDLEDRGRLEEVGGVAFTQNLPEHVAQRMANAARKAFLGQELKVRTERTSGHSTGAGLALYARYQNTRLGADALGEKGVPAEKVGEDAVARMKDEMDGPGTLDVHAADQLLAYMALAERPSRFIVADISSHLSTQMWLLKRFLPVEFIEHERDDGFLVEVRPNRTSREG